jgi:uncharacterized membrane protein YsdA (DUF1294 family)/cold shock CspA family protein
VRAEGRISSWVDEKGYGFVDPVAGGPRVFLHISAFDDRGRRPSTGDTVTYEKIRGKDGRMRAARAVLVGRQARRRGHGTALTAGVTSLLSIACIGILVLLAEMNVLVFAAYLVASLITFGYYAFDKFAARKGSWRVSEATLHLLALAGGWPGALAAQQVFRHKTRKKSFRFVFWTTILINLGILGWLGTQDGRAFIGSALSGNY